MQISLVELDVLGREHVLSTAPSIPWNAAQKPLPAFHAVKIEPRFAVQCNGSRIMNRRGDGTAAVVERLVIRVDAVQCDKRGQPVCVPASKRPLVPEFMNIWTAPYRVRAAGPSKIALELDDGGGAWLQRRIVLSSLAPQMEDDATPSDEEQVSARAAAPELRLWEEAGESIARHVWYVNVPTRQETFKSLT